MKDKKIVFTNGCFDILHPGHIKLLEDAKTLGDTLVVGLNSDESIRKIKGPSRPIVDEKARKLILLSLSCVDRVYLFDDVTPEKLIRLVCPYIIVKGSDYLGKKVVGSDFVRRVAYINIDRKYSTTKIINSIVEKYK